jgi:peroxiredoxin
MELKKDTIAPDFTAIDSEGRTVNLSDYKGKKKVVLVFNRGFFCPHTRRHMAELRQDYQKFVDRNTEVITIGPEDAKVFAEWWHNEQIPFVGIADPEHVIANLYGQKVNILKFGRMPAMLVIDKEGKIRYVHYGNSMSDIPQDEENLSLLDGLNKK